MSGSSGLALCRTVVNTRLGEAVKYWYEGDRLRCRRILTTYIMGDRAMLEMPIFCIIMIQTSAYLSDRGGQSSIIVIFYNKIIYIL